jgi:hypothetical protein
MPAFEQMTQQPVFFALAVISVVLTVGYYWGSSANRKLFFAIYDELSQVIRPTAKNYGNIGGSKEYYANFTLHKESPLAKVDAKFTFLPRQLWPYLPIAMLVDKYDQLLVALHFKQKLREEGHLIEAEYMAARTARIANSDKFNLENLKWGSRNFRIYYKNKKTGDRFKELVGSMDDPGVVRHIALLPEQKKCFVFLIPRKGRVAKDMAPVYRWLLDAE